MKHLLVFLVLCLFANQTIAQPIITSLTVFPVNPTTADNIKVIATLQFPSSGCALDNNGHSLQGTTIMASSHHCVGMLTAICTTTDTFELGQLAVGTYIFDLTLTSGFGGPGCTAGIVPDDNDQLSFTVSGSVGIEELLNTEIAVFPNPTTDKLNFNLPLQETSQLLNLSGQIIVELQAGTQEVDISNLPSGVYILQKSTQRIKIVKL